MKPVRVHSWNIGPDEATAIQHNLRGKVVFAPISEDIRYVGATGTRRVPRNSSDRPSDYRGGGNENTDQWSSLANIHFPSIVFWSVINIFP